MLTHLWRSSLSKDGICAVGCRTPCVCIFTFYLCFWASFILLCFLCTVFLFKTNKTKNQFMYVVCLRNQTYYLAEANPESSCCSIYFYFVWNIKFVWNITVFYLDSTSPQKRKPFSQSPVDYHLTSGKKEKIIFL